MHSDRRTFLMGAAGLPAAFASQTVAASDTLGTAMIGVGNRGSYLLRGVMEQPGVRVAAVCDIKPDRLDKAASTAARDKPVTSKDYREVLARKDVDAVYIATPCDLHPEMVIAALKAGKHVYCEKPLGIEPRSIAEVVKVARASNRVFQIGQQGRSSTQRRNAIERIHNEGILGKMVMVKAQRHASADLNHNGPSADWFFDAKRSGDVIVEMSVHNLDACNWIIGSRPERAAGFGGNLVWVNDPPGRTNMDGYSLTYEYQNGVKLSYTQVFFHAPGMPGGGQFTYVYGTKGSVDMSTSTFYPLDRKAGKPVVLAPEVKDAENAHIAAFFESIRTGKKPPADIEIAATAALTAILGRDSIYRKQVLKWDDLGVRL